MEINEENFLLKYTEKPTLFYQVSMGIYMMNREVLKLIPHNEYFDVPNLMNKLLDENKKPLIFPFEGRWLDIGRKEDYEKAVDEFELHKSIFLPT